MQSAQAQEALALWGDSDEEADEAETFNWNAGLKPPLWSEMGRSGLPPEFRDTPGVHSRYLLRPAASQVGLCIDSCPAVRRRHVLLVIILNLIF